MAFWTFCCKPWQLYGIGTAPDGYSARTVDNEGNWSAIAGGYAIKGGELWAWAGAGAQAAAFQEAGPDGGNGEGFARARRIGNSGGWTGFAYYDGDPPEPHKSDPGFYVMKGETPYAIDNTMAGTGLVPGSASQSGFTTRYRARLSSAVESVSLISTPGSPVQYYGKKPALSVASVRIPEPTGENYILTNEPGSGAVIDCDFTPSPFYWAVTNGGSGYTTPPSVTLTPSHADDADATGTARVSRMSNVPIVGFSVTSAGSGYTAATVTERYTGAKATAVIQDGQIVSWTLTSAGFRLVNPLSLNVLDVLVCGDGSGGVAAAVTGGGTVQDIDFDEGEWHHPPIVSFTGGGGSGAAATVFYVGGAIQNLRVVHGGSGYTHCPRVPPGGNGKIELKVVAQPAADDDLIYDFYDWEPGWEPYPVGNVRLAPSQVSSVVESPSWMWLPADQNADQVNPGSSGRVLPFSWPMLYAQSAYIEKPDGSQVALSVNAEGVSLSEAVEGFGSQEPYVVVLLSTSPDIPPTEYRSKGNLKMLNAWEPASIPQPTFLYYEPPIRGAPATATVNPSGTIAITQTGGEYREEPAALRVTGAWPEPRQVDVPTVPATSSYTVVDGKMQTNTGFLVWPLEITTDAHGSKYSRPPRVRIDPPKSPTDVEPTNFDGRVAVVGVIRGGAGYSTPPTLTIDAPTGSGGTKVTATATAVIVGPVVVTLTNGGSGYRTAPSVSFSQPGLSAKAVASINGNGAVIAVDVVDGGRYRVAPTVTITPVADVESLTITNGGAGYTSTPSVVIAGGGGDGAKATCTINASGQVDSVTLTARGRAFDRPPTVVFVGGGCTTPATATAAIAAVGSGATCAATLDGSIEFVNVANGGAYYREFPSVTVDTASNWRIAASAAALAAGDITQAEHDAEVARCTGKLTTRILARVRNGSNSLRGPRLPNQAYDQQANEYYYQWLDVPRPDYYRLKAITNLTRHARGLQRTSETPVAGERIGIRVGETGICHVGALSTFEDYNRHSIPTYLRTAYWSTLPAVTVEDEAGTGATASLTYSGQFVRATVQSQGTGYTGWAGISVSGGVPRSWDNPASAIAVVENGRVTAITIQSGGAGYYWPPTVLIVGGGGSGAIALPAVLNANGSIISIPVEGCGGSGYTSAPTVYIISNDQPFGKRAGDEELQETAYQQTWPVLAQCKAEYAVRSTRQQRSVIGWQLPTEATSENARIWEIYDDDGYVEDVFFENDEAANLNYTPDILIEDGGDDASGAVATAHEVTWSSLPFKRA